jgi:hypothetical protein
MARTTRTITMRCYSSSLLSRLPFVLLLADRAGAQEAPSCASWPAAAKYAASVRSFCSWDYQSLDPKGFGLKFLLCLSRYCGQPLSGFERGIGYPKAKTKAGP